MKRIEIAGRRIGEGEPCFILLELGVNFRDMNEAKMLVDAAVATGADAVKFQTFHADNVAMKGAVLYDGRGEVDQWKELYESEAVLTDEFQTEIIRYAQRKGSIAFSTPSHRTDVDLLERIGVPAYKLGSDDLTNLPLLRCVAAIGKPMIISCGASTLEDVDEAVRAIRGEGNEQILLLHCVSAYPSQPSDMNLRTMQTLKSTFDVPVGLSDHTEGIGVAIGASALGAAAIEKHFTLDRNMPGPDNFFSMEPGPMKQIVDAIREVEAAQGSSCKDVRPVEEEMVTNFHKSIFAREPILKGELVCAEKVEILRPLIGIPAKDFDEVLGMAPMRDIEAGRALQWEDFKK